MSIDKDGFEQWRADPITQALFKKLERIAANAKTEWLDRSFGAPIESINALVLARLRTYNSLCLQIVNMSYEDINEATD
jgi:hypothetical protein